MSGQEALYVVIDVGCHFEAALVVPVPEDGEGQ